MRKASASEFHRKCALLEVDTVNTAAELLRIYRKLINKWHPDRHNSDVLAYERATSRAMEINGAFEYLSELFDNGLAPPTEPTASESFEKWQRATASYQTRHQYRQRTYRTGYPDPSIVEVFVKSSNIVSIGYDKVGEILYIKFVGNTVYRYFQVPNELFNDFLLAPSQGQFANKKVFRLFRYESC